MFKKVGLIITSAGGFGVKDTVRLIKSNMFYWGVPTIYNYGVTTMKMGGNYEDYKNKDKIKKQVKVKAGKIKRSLKNKKIGLKSKFFFNIFRMTQKNGWNKTDSDYWRDKGWLNGKKPHIKRNILESKLQKNDEVIPELDKIVALSDLFACKLDTMIKEDMSAGDAVYSEIIVKKVKAFQMERYVMLSPNPGRL